MPRPLIALVVAVALVGCKRSGPTEPSQGDAKEAYVTYKELAAESRAARLQMNNRISTMIELETQVRNSEASEVGAPL